MKYLNLFITFKGHFIAVSLHRQSLASFSFVFILFKQLKKTVDFSSGQSYKASTIVIYDSRVIPDLKIPPYYDSRVVNYKRKLFIRLATGFKLRFPGCVWLLHINLQFMKLVVGSSLHRDLE